MAGPPVEPRRWFARLEYKLDCLLCLRFL